MLTYMYQAALWCDDCGHKLVEQLTGEGKAPEDPTHEHTYDSDDFPKGPYESEESEADCPHHCDGCGIFLENPLTTHGKERLYDDVLEGLSSGTMSDVMREWVDFYDVTLPELIDYRCPKSATSEVESEPGDGSGDDDGDIPGTGDES